MERGNLYCYVGPMSSGKTSLILNEITNIKNIFEQSGKKLRCIYISNLKDNRENLTHSSLFKDLNGIKILKEEKLNLPKLIKYDVIAIDEFQMFKGEVDNVISLVEKHKKIVYVSSLDGDSTKKIFGEVYLLLPHSDSFKKLTATCYFCLTNKGRIEKGLFSIRMTKQTDQIVIGGLDIYKPSCRICYDIFHKKHF